MQYIYTLSLKSLGSVKCCMFFKEMSCQGNVKISYFCDQSLIFSIIIPVFSVTWSFRNHSNMQMYNNCWKLLCCFNFLGGLFWGRYFFLYSLINKKFKRTACIKCCVTICIAIQKFGVSTCFIFLKKLIILFRRIKCVKWIKSHSKYLYCINILIQNV